MRTEQQIYMDYQNAKYTAERLEGFAVQTSDLSVLELSDALEVIPSCWEGEPCSPFLEKGRSIFEDLQTIAEQLYKISTAMQTAAGNIYQAEMAALEYVRDHG